MPLSLLYKMIPLFFFALRPGFFSNLKYDTIIARDKKLLRFLLCALKQRYRVRHIIEQRIVHFFVVCHAIDLLRLFRRPPLCGIETLKELIVKLFLSFTQIKIIARNLLTEMNEHTVCLATV